jgi:hypothetical protein
LAFYEVEGPRLRYTIAVRTVTVNGAGSRLSSKGDLERMTSKSPRSVEVERWNRNVRFG